MNATTDTILDLDELMQSTLDNIEDVPDYVEPDSGTYALSVIEAEIKKSKEAGKASRIILTYRIDGIIELSQGGHPVPEGSLFNESFQGTAEGLKYFKKQAKKLLNVEELNGIPMSDLLEALKALDSFNAVVSKKLTKGKEEGTTYTNINVRPVYES